MKDAYVIGICGGSASGKTTVANNLVSRINEPWVVIQSLDSFYKVLSEEQHEAALRMEYDFDHPDAIDSKLAVETIKRMKQGKYVAVPIYDFTTHSRVLNKHTTVFGANVIIVEGLMTFHYEELFKLCDLKIYVDTDSDLRLCRRIKRDIEERGRNIQQILLQYGRFVKPNFEKYIAPLLSFADVVIPWSHNNYSAIDMIAKLIKGNLESRGFMFRSKLLISSVDDTNVEVSHTNFHLVKQTNNIVGLSTNVRDILTTRENFCINSLRLMRICILETVSLISERYNIWGNDEKSDKPFKKICAVSIMKSGEAFHDAIKDIVYDYSYGKIRIQSNKTTREPELYNLRLPKDISNSVVLLCDATISTGAAALMAIRILIDNEVNEEDIYFTSIITSNIGVKTILNAFPKIKLISSAIDSQVDKNYHIIPGIGNFRERYFGN